MLSTNPLSDKDRELIGQAREKAFILYEGKRTPHRSCGVCLAETFGVPWKAYQALRRGGVTGEGSCGAIRAGEMILGELLGPCDPAGPVTPEMRDGLIYYQQRWKEKQASAGWPDTICNTLVAPFLDFKGPERAGFCTSMAADAAELVAETLVRCGYQFKIEPLKFE